MKSKGRVIPGWLSKYVDDLENVIFSGRLEEFWNRLISKAEIKTNEKVVDIGCGSGRLTLLVANQLRNSGEIIGLDASESMIKLCQEKNRSARFPVKFQVGIMEELSFPDNYFDVVISSFALHHVPLNAKLKALNEFKRVLNLEGRLLILDHGKPYKWWLNFLLFPMRWNIIEFQAENFRGEVPRMIKSIFHNVKEMDRFYGWIRIWEARKKSA